MKLVITEKPSVSRSLSKVIGAYKEDEGYFEGSGYIVSWCIGHLVRMAEPDVYDKKYRKWNCEDLPILPDQFLWHVDPQKAKQFQVLKGLMEREDVDEIICATDAGREGELIFRLVYYQAGCKKPWKRLWISSMEDSAIKKGFANLKDGHAYDNLYRAAMCRSQADWLIGINATRLFTTLYNRRLIIGRVQTPTLAMIADREKEIKDFVKEKYYSVQLEFEGLTAVRDNISSEEEARNLTEKCNGREAVVRSVNETVRIKKPPLLYDLTALQREANRYFGYTAKQTLDTTQKLYEKKLITYPRTDSRYLTEDMDEPVRQLAMQLGSMYFGEEWDLAEPDIYNLINEKKVSDHTAILPTQEILNLDSSTLQPLEKNILDLIAGQLLCAAERPAEYWETHIILDCMGEEFIAKGKKLLESGWKEREASCKLRGYKRTETKNESRDEEQILPSVEKGHVYNHADASVKEHYTRPPEHYSEDSLLLAMETAGQDSFDKEAERKGLGTPATRASMIEKLVSSGYVIRKGKQLLPTQEGTDLAAIVPEEIRSPKLTAEWEHNLVLMEKGEIMPAQFMTGIRELTKELTDRYRSLPENERAGSFVRPSREPIGYCPRCGAPVYEGRVNFYCSSKDCSFCLWKDNKWLSGMNKSVNAKMARSLLEDGRIHVSGLYSRKKNRTFSADLVLEDTGTYVNYRLEFPDSRKKKKGSR